MKFEVFLQGIDGTFEISSLCDSVTISSTRNIAAGTLELSFLDKLEGLTINQGDIVKFVCNDYVMFVGYVVKDTLNNKNVYSISALDQLFYLKTNDSFYFENQSATEIIQEVAAKVGAKTGELEDTGYKFPTLLRENKSCLDVINYALMVTSQQNQKIYSLYDDGGKITLKETKNMIIDLEFAVGVNNMLTDFEFSRSIENSYNQIKLVRPNKETGKTDVYIAKDSENIKKWGLLQHYDKIDEGLNEGQITERLESLLTYYNIVTKNLTIKSLGIPQVRGGSMILLNIPKLDIHPSKYVLIDKVTHNFKNGDHTMDLETKNIL